MTIKTSPSISAFTIEGEPVPLSVEEKQAVLDMLQELAAEAQEEGDYFDVQGSKVARKDQ